MAETRGAPHSDECATAEGGECYCACNGQMHGIKAKGGKLRRMGDVKVTATGKGDKKHFRVVDESTGRPPGGGTTKDNARAAEKPAAKPTDEKRTASSGGGTGSTTPAKPIPKREGKTRRGDVVVIEEKSTTSFVGAPNQERTDYRAYEVTSVTRDGGIKKVRELGWGGAPQDVSRNPRKFGGRKSVIPGEQIDIAGLEDTLKKRTYPGSSTPMPHDSIKSIGEAIRPNLKGEDDSRSGSSSNTGGGSREQRLADRAADVKVTATGGRDAGGYVPPHVRDALDTIEGRRQAPLPLSYLYGGVARDSYERHFTAEQRAKVLETLRGILPDMAPDARDRSMVQQAVGSLEDIARDRGETRAKPSVGNAKPPAVELGEVDQELRRTKWDLQLVQEAGPAGSGLPGDPSQADLQQRVRGLEERAAKLRPQVEAEQRARKVEEERQAAAAAAVNAKAEAEKAARDAENAERTRVALAEIQKRMDAERAEKIANLPPTDPAVAQKIENEGVIRSTILRGMPAEARNSANDSPYGVSGLRFGGVAADGTVTDADGRVIGRVNPSVSADQVAAGGWIAVDTNVPAAMPIPGREFRTVGVWKPPAPAAGTALDARGKRQQLNEARERLAAGDDAAKAVGKKPSLEVSDDGRFLIFNEGRGDWRVGRASDGRRAVMLLDNKEQAREYARKLGELRDHDGNPVNFDDAASLRSMQVTRDGRTEPMSQAIGRIENEARGGEYLNVQTRQDEQREQDAARSARLTAKYARGGYTRVGTGRDIKPGDEVAYVHQPGTFAGGTLKGYQSADGPVLIRGRVTYAGERQIDMLDVRWESLDGDKSGTVDLGQNATGNPATRVGLDSSTRQVHIRADRGGSDGRAPTGSRYEVQNRRRTNGYWGPVVVRIEPDGNEVVVNATAATQRAAEQAARDMRKELRARK